MPSSVEPAVSIIIVSWNTRELLRACLRAVAREAAQVGAEVVVVDNDSADGSAAMVATEYPDVKLVRNPENRGFGAACNQGLALAGGRFVMLLNPDAEPRPGAIAALLAFLSSAPHVGAVGPLIVREGDEPGLTYGHFPSLSTALWPLVGPLAGRLPGGVHLPALGVVPPPPGPGAGPREVDYVSGAAMTLRRAALDQVGGFDERFFLYFEETDLCRRLRGSGWRVVYLPAAIVEHREGASRDKRSAPALAEYYRSFDRYLRKHHSAPYVALLRGAFLLGLGLRYLAARAAARGALARHYLASVRALWAGSHA